MQELLKLLNRSEAAEILNVSLRNLDERTARGEIRVVRVGRSVRYKRESLEDFIEANETAVKPNRRRARVETPTEAGQ